MSTAGLGTIIYQLGVRWRPPYQTLNTTALAILASLHTAPPHVSCELATHVTCKNCSEERYSPGSLDTLPRVILNIPDILVDPDPILDSQLDDPKKPERFQWLVYLRPQI